MQRGLGSHVCQGLMQSFSKCGSRPVGRKRPAEVPVDGAQTLVMLETCSFTPCLIRFRPET